MAARSLRFIAFFVLAVAPTFGAAADDEKAGRVELFGLVTAAPLPTGYLAKRQDFQTVDGTGNTLIFLTKADSKSRVQVTIENKKLATKEEKVAAFKAAVNGIHGTFTKRGYRVQEIEHPDSKTLDPEQRLDLRLKLQKDAKPLFVDAEIFFTDHAYTAWSVTPDEAERETLKAWIGTVRAK